MNYKFFDKKVFGANTLSGAVMHARSRTSWSETLATRAVRDTQDKVMSDQILAEELQEPIIRKFEKQKVHLSFLDNIWGAVLADMQIISNLIKEFDFDYVLLIFSVNMHGLSL